MTNSPPNINSRIPSHGVPVPLFRCYLAQQDTAELAFCDTVWIATANMHCFTSGSITEFCPVRFATVTSSKRFILKNQCFRNNHRRHRQKEPLALTEKRSVSATISRLARNSLSTNSSSHFCWLQRFHCLTHSSNGSCLGNSGYRPMSFVMTTEILALRSIITDQQQQVAIGRLNIQNFNHGISIRSRRNLEIFASPIQSDVKHQY